MRIQFDISGEALEWLDELQKKTGLVSRAAVIREAIGSYRWIIDKAEQGYTIFATGEDEKVVIELRMQGIDFAAFRARRDSQT